MNYASLKSVLSNKEDIPTIINILTSQAREIDIDKLKKQYDPAQHDVHDTVKRKKREVKNSTGGTDVEDVTRIAFPMQENIVSKATSFLFGNDVEIVCNTEIENEKLVLGAIKRINKDVKINSHNWTIAEHLFKSTQVCEIWYAVEQEEAHQSYGFSTKTKLRVSPFSPWDDNELFPYYDETGDLIAFSRRYSFKDDNKKSIVHFEIYTKDSHILFENNPNAQVQGWQLLSETPNPIKKIRVVYAWQDKAEWEKVQWSINRLEFLLSNFGDTNDYNGAPILFATGTISDMPGKVTTGKLIQGAPQSDMKYISWANAPESIKLEIEMHFRVIHTYTQTPDVSFENIKGIGAISGVALELFFMDAHLKVMDKRRIFDPFLQRRTNIQKEFIIAMKQDLKDAARNMDIDCVIKPYMIKDLAARVKILLEATGGKAILSQETGTEMSGLVEDGLAEYKRITDEAAEAQKASLFEPAEV